MLSIFWSVLIIGLILLVLIFYIFAFIFVSGSSPSGKPYDSFVDKTCSPSQTAFFKTVFTWGYFKASYRRFHNFYKLKILRRPQASLGSKCPCDINLIRLDGSTKSLGAYLLEAGDCPVVLNFGSYT